MNGLLFIAHQTERHSYLQSIELALEGGCKEIQLRMKDASIEELLSVGKQVKQLCDTYNAKLYIDDHAEVCKKLNATGVHLGKNDMPPSQARELLGDNYIIGGTANTFEDIIHLHKQGVNYVGLGPFRFTTTKKNLSPVLGVAGYTSIIHSCREAGIHLPIIAIGGITETDIPAIMETGVSTIAISSSILTATDPISETKKLIKLIDTYKR